MHIAQVYDFITDSDFEEQFEVVAENCQDNWANQSLIGFHCKEGKTEYEYLLKTEKHEFFWRSKHLLEIKEQAV